MNLFVRSNHALLSLICWGKLTQQTIFIQEKRCTNNTNYKLRGYRRIQLQTTSFKLRLKENSAINIMNFILKARIPIGKEYKVAKTVSQACCICHSYSYTLQQMNRRQHSNRNLKIISLKNHQDLHDLTFIIQSTFQYQRCQIIEHS